jgi:hypothetical protein
MGRGAPINNPFDGYWLGVEYFYLGLIQDAGDRIDQLSRIVVDDERHLLMKLLNFGNLLLAAHRTEYAYIEQSLHQLIIEIAKHFIDVGSGKKSSAFSETPKLQFLAILSLNLRYVLGFDYFKKALESVSLQIELDSGLSDEQKIVGSFLVDSVRASLGETDVFRFLIEKSSGDLDWVIKLGIYHVAQDEGLRTNSIEKFEKKMAKMRKGNNGLALFIKDLYETSMIDLRKKMKISSGA